jgi:predicted transcriptional regulator
MKLTNKSRLTPETAREIRRVYAEGNVSQGILARRYGVSQSLINNLVLNKTYVEENNDEPK